MKVEEIKIALQKNQETHLQFALIDDIKADIQMAKKLKDGMKSSKNSAVNQLIKYNDSLTGLASVSGRAIKGIQELEKKAKELGLDQNTIVTPYKKELEQIRKDAISESGRVSNMLSSI